MPTTTPFNNLITFSRGSNATVTGSNGLIQWAPNNLLTFSEQFDNSAWIKSASGQVTVTANQAVAPDGTRTADLVVPNASSGYHNIRQGPTTAALVYTQTVYYKPSGYTKVAIREDFAVGQYAAFDCVGSGTIINKTATASASITALADGWYQLTLTPTTTTANQGMGVYIMDAGYTSGDPPSYIFTGNGTSGGFLWGAQLELGSTATTYNSTTVKNLLGFSEAFDNAFWVKTRASIVTGAAANPVNGLFNAQKLMEDTTASNSHVITGAGGTVGSVETLSVYARAAGRQWLTFQIGTTASAYFNIGTGVLGTVTNGTASIVNIGGGWYRCSLTATRAGTTNNFIFLASADLTVNYTGDGNSGVYIYGAQLSDSASLDPYVPTPGAAPSSIAFYGPRFDFDPVTLQPRGLLVEEQRTNSLTNSEDWSNAVWSKNSVTISTNATAAPSGGLTADKIIPDASGVGFFSEQAFSVTAGTTYTASIFLKAAEISSGISIILGTGGLWPSGNPNITVNLANGTITSSGGVSASSIINFGNGWYRVTLTQTASVTGTSSLRISPTSGLAGNGINGIFIWGAQLEAGAFATSYIPTVASTVTRSADVATITGQNFAQWFANNEGSFVFEGSSFGIGSNLPTFLNASDGTTNNYLRMNGASGYTGRSFVQSGGATSANITVGAGLVSGVNAKAAAAYATNSFQLAVNATLGTEDTSGAVPVTPNQIAFGNWFGSAGTILNGHIRNIRFIPARAADFQLQGLST